ncbi:MAG: PLP-dependent transferase [Clostridia bacterium]|nr:PLP-dependent transferase [Clostridia bacterium]
MSLTPICDFVAEYAKKAPLRLHMPGHKGVGSELERFDITEVEGADSLYCPQGIIAQSMAIAGEIFGADTFYSAEGSSLSIRAMLRLVSLYAAENGRAPIVAAGRNAHKTFLTAAAMLDVEPIWIYPLEDESYLSCNITPSRLEDFLSCNDPVAVYLTSPDYPGNMLDIKGLSEVCRRHGVLLLVDNAHGAYLKFLPRSLHPIDLGADLCCDSAHKTLPALTGGGYLHVSRSAPSFFAQQASEAMALFGSTSPSYLILRSLDALNGYLTGGYKERLEGFISEVDSIKKKLCDNGFTLLGNEPLKLTLDAPACGYSGSVLAALLAEKNIRIEFSDPDIAVMMLTPELGKAGLEQLLEAILSIPILPAITPLRPRLDRPERAMSVRRAMLSPCESIPSESCVGRILAQPTVGCPPAVPPIVSGERINPSAAEVLSYYGISSCTVVKE